MALTFYYASGSPFAWKVWLVLEHLRVPHELRVLSFQAGDLRKPEFGAINPRHKVPAIVDDGFALYESSAIVEYLDERYHDDGSTVWPGDLRARARARRIAAEADDYYYPVARRLLAQTLFRPGDDGDRAEIRAARQGLADELVRWEAMVNDRFLAGPEPSAADYALYPQLAITRRLAEKQPRHEVGPLIGPQLRGWMDRVEALPYAPRTTPPHWRTY